MRDDSTQQLQILHTVARELSSSVHLEQILRITLDQVAALLQLETGWVFLLDAQDRFSLAASLNLPPGLAAEPARMSGWCYCLDQFRHDALHSAQNVSMIACTRLSGLAESQPEGAAGLRFHASIPLQAGDQKLGVLNAASAQKQALSPDELHTLFTIGDLLSLAILRTRFYAEHLSHSALRERYRLARELHDSLGQGLAALIMRLDTLDALIDKQAPPEALKACLGESARIARGTLRSARTAVQNLRSDETTAAALPARVQQLVAELLLSQEITFDLDPGLQLSPALAHSLFRMLQELITNIHKHAQAQQVSISLNKAASGLHLQVRDDGVGFDPAAVGAGHFGLIGLRERVHLLQGELCLASVPGQGTRVDIRLPGETA